MKANFSHVPSKLTSQPELSPPQRNANTPSVSSSNLWQPLQSSVMKTNKVMLSSQNADGKAVHILYHHDLSLLWYCKCFCWHSPIKLTLGPVHNCDTHKMIVYNENAASLYVSIASNFVTGKTSSEEIKKVIIKMFMLHC